MGLAFGAGYRCHAYPIGFALVAGAGALEMLQVLVPGRHARLSDFVVDALGACFGVAISRWLARPLPAA
jgi:VanZ family protein